MKFLIHDLKLINSKKATIIWRTNIHFIILSMRDMFRWIPTNTSFSICVALWVRRLLQPIIRFPSLFLQKVSYSTGICNVYPTCMWECCCIYLLHKVPPPTYLELLKHVVLPTLDRIITPFYYWCHCCTLSFQQIITSFCHCCYCCTLWFQKS